MQQREFIFRLSISAEQYLRHYQGSARHIVVQSHDGRTVRFPAAILRRFVTREGVHGEFRLRYDHAHRLISFERLTDGSEGDV